MLFFDMMLFFLSQKNNDCIIFCIVSYKTMQTFDIVLKTIHRPSVNRFDGAIFLVRFDYQDQSDDDTTEV